MIANQVTLQSLQKYIKAKDYRPNAKLEYLQKLVEEVGELARAMRHEIRYVQTRQIKGTLEEELYDVLYYVVAIANLYDVDLETAMRLKDPVGSEKYGQLEQSKKFLE